MSLPWASEASFCTMASRHPQRPSPRRPSQHPRHRQRQPLRRDFGCQLSNNDRRFYPPITHKQRYRTHVPTNCYPNSTTPAPTRQRSPTLDHVTLAPGLCDIDLRARPFWRKVDTILGNHLVCRRRQNRWRQRRFLLDRRLHQPAIGAGYGSSRRRNLGGAGRVYADPTHRTR